MRDSHDRQDGSRHQRPAQAARHDRELLARTYHAYRRSPRGHDAQRATGAALSHRLTAKADTATIPALQNPGSNAAARAMPNSSDHQGQRGGEPYGRDGGFLCPNGAPIRGGAEHPARMAEGNTHPATSPDTDRSAVRANERHPDRAKPQATNPTPRAQARCTNAPHREANRRKRHKTRLHRSRDGPPKPAPPSARSSRLARGVLRQANRPVDRGGWVPNVPHA
jgi:hypothetical protein